MCVCLCVDGELGKRVGSIFRIWISQGNKRVTAWISDVLSREGGRPGPGGRQGPTQFVNAVRTKELRKSPGGKGEVK